MFGIFGANPLMNPLCMLQKFMNCSNSMKGNMGSNNGGACYCPLTGNPLGPLGMGGASNGNPMSCMGGGSMSNDLYHQIILCKLHKIIEMMQACCNHVNNCCNQNMMSGMGNCHQNMMPNMGCGLGQNQNKSCSMPTGSMGGGSMYHNEELAKMMNIAQMSMMFLDNFKNSTTHINDMLKDNGSSCSSSKECNLEALKMKIDYWQGVFDKFYAAALECHKKAFGVMDNINENLKTVKNTLDNHLKSVKDSSKDNAAPKTEKESKK